LSRFTLRLVTLALVSAVVVIGGASTALASLATDSSNADITVVASMVSNNAVDTGQATDGDIVTASGSVTNNTGRKQLVKLTRTLEGPNGALYSKTTGLMLSAGETYSASDSLVVSASVPAGVYTITVSARGTNGTSSASASITVY
jgi:hypothetical protein